jgi:(5-formylfuran-3-yl)methyl phosphate synthase
MHASTNWKSLRHNLMQQLKKKNRPGLLVSVRSADEALAALAGGADVIDVKEPKHGSLGAADRSTVADVVRAVAEGAPVSAAAGELLEIDCGKRQPMPEGVSLFKIGLAGCRAAGNWRSHWRNAVEAHAAPNGNPFQQAVAVAYADWRSAGAPDPREVLRLATGVGSPALLVDTWDKTSGSLFDHWNASEMREFVNEVQSLRLMIVLAGSLIGDSITKAAQLRPDVIAVRTAACDSGRNGPVSNERVRAVRHAISIASGQLSVAAILRNR